MKVRICTGSRLHFGLLAFGPQASRQFGGVGVMVERPGVELVAEASSMLSAEGVLAHRALESARRCLEDRAFTGRARPAGARIEVVRASAEHIGLGTGTQLAMAVAAAMSKLAGEDDLGPARLAAMVGRGRRSALGVHGFARGGLVVEGGQRDPGAIAPLIGRIALPDSWRFVLLLPEHGRGLYGEAEQRAFERLGAIDDEVTAKLCRTVVLSLLPAAAEGDFDAFSEALFEFGRRVGECFAPVQDGIYATKKLADIVELLRQNGVRGAGQSSWGPTLFALAEDPEHATRVAHLLQERGAAHGAQIVITAAANQGARLEVLH